MTISFLPVFAAALSAFLLGGLWYSPKLFGEVWNREAGLNPKKLKGGHGPRVFIVAFLASFVAAGAFAVYLEPEPPLGSALQGALTVGLGWVATSFTINYQFGGRSLKLLAIDAGYHLAQFLLYGVILGLWH